MRTTADVPDLEDFTARAVAFLSSRARPREEVEFVWGQGRDDDHMFAEHDPDEELDDWERVRQWRRTCFDAGFGWITGPKAVGGAGLPVEFERVWSELCAGYDVPSESGLSIGLTFVAPTVERYGTEQQKEQLLPSLHRADIVACQLFSEPNAGSDLASVQTSAVRDGDEWIISGQKVWTTNAHRSDVGEVLCRTDSSGRKHDGLTVFVIDMHAPGVDVRPLRQATGGCHFNEVFLDQVRVGDDARLGPIGEGWRVATTTLRNERKSIGSAGLGLDAPTEPVRLAALARESGRSRDPIVRQQLADVFARRCVARWTAERAVAQADQGLDPGPELSIGKLLITDNQARVSALVSALLGPRLIADSGEWGTFSWGTFVVGLPGFRISGGTDEIQKNVLAERVLGLPREPSAQLGGGVATGPN